MSERFEWRTRAGSFVYAWRGIQALVVHEHNARIHLAIAAAVIALGLWLDVSRLEWAVLALAIGSVLCAEALNAAIEALADAVHAEPHPLIERAKDMAAGGVLIIAATAAVAGLCVLAPSLWQKVFGAD